MRAKLIELMAPRWCLALNSGSEKRALTMSYEKNSRVSSS